MLMSVGQVFAPIAHYLCDRGTDAFFSSGTIRGVLSTFPQNEETATLIAKGNEIAKRKTEEESRALVTLVKKFFKPHLGSVIRLEQFYNFLKLADHFSTIEEADLAFSKVPISTYNHYIWGCNVNAFAKSLGLGFLVEPRLRSSLLMSTVEEQKIIESMTRRIKQMDGATTSGTALISIAGPAPLYTFVEPSRESEHIKSLMLANQQKLKGEHTTISQEDRDLLNAEHQKLLRLMNTVSTSTFNIPSMVVTREHSQIHSYDFTQLNPEIESRETTK